MNVRQHRSGCKVQSAWRCFTPPPHPPCAQVEVDFKPLCDIAAMLYGTSFVAERYSGIRSFLEQGKAGVSGAWVSSVAGWHGGGKAGGWAVAELLLLDCFERV